MTIDNLINDTLTIDPIVSCHVCQKPATFMCSSCKRESLRYCSVKCQKDDWNQRHFKDCKTARKTYEQNSDTFVRDQTDQENENTQLNDLLRDNDRHQSSNHIEKEECEKEECEKEECEKEELIKEELAEDLKFYMDQIYRIIKPVVVCIILSIFWVKVAFGGSSDYSPSRTNYVNVSTPTLTNSTNSGTSLAQSFTNAGIIIGQIIAVTIIIVFLFKKGWIKALIGFFMIIVLLLLGFMTYLLLLNLVQVFSIPLDYITMIFALWNFAMVGLVSIFWKSPLWLQQCFLTIMSSLMAFSLTGLEEWTTWILLGLLAIWDLIAVLCPFGPLRMLIESSKAQQREVPALLYSVNAVWFMMASTDHFKPSNSSSNVSSFVVRDDALLRTTNKSISISSSSNQNKQPTDQSHINNNNVIHRHSTGTISSIQMASIIRQSHDEFMRLQDNNRTAINAQGEQVGFTSVTTTVHPTSRTPEQQQIETVIVTAKEEEEDEDAERNGLKLGLGDFVFYSVLIARAAMYDWITTVCCTIAVLTGLTTTIFLLAIYKKALPALPVSIAFGILFYFVAKTVLVPYVSALCVFGMVGL